MKKQLRIYWPDGSMDFYTDDPKVAANCSDPIRAYVDSIMQQYGYVLISVNKDRRIKIYATTYEITEYKATK